MLRRTPEEDEAFEAALSGRYTPCRACGAIALRGRAEEHWRRPECVLRQVAAYYKARGWARAGGLGPILRRAGFEVHRAPVALSGLMPADEAVPRGHWLGAARSPRVRVPMGGPWAEKTAVEVAAALSSVRPVQGWGWGASKVPVPHQKMSPLRRLFLHLCAQRPGLLEAAAAARQLGGPEALLALVERTQREARTLVSTPRPFGGPHGC